MTARPPTAPPTMAPMLLPPFSFFGSGWSGSAGSVDDPPRPTVPEELEEAVELARPVLLDSTVGTARVELLPVFVHVKKVRPSVSPSQVVLADCTREPLRVSQK